jgi:RND family efflux transporter MFP subunit
LLALGTGCGDGQGSSGEDGDAAADSLAVESSEDAADGADEAEDEERASRSRERALSVTASAVVRAELVVPVIAEGTIRARRQAEIRFELTGRIERVRVQEGQRVRRGQVLASLDDREYRVALEEAKASFLRSLGQIAVEEESLSAGGDLKGLLDEQLAELDAMERRGEITREERRERELELGVAAVKDGAYRRELLEVRSGLATARANEARAELNLERTVLRAPFDGVVTELELQPGERVQVGDLLCTIVDDLDLEAEIGVLESDLGAVESGRPALLTLPALEQTIPVTVDVVSPRIDPASRTCQVLLRLRSEDGKIKPGMFVRAAIAGAIYEDRLLVPREAILTRDGRPLLFKVEDDRARWVYVELGLRNDNAVEIARVVQGGPLDEGTLVVVDNHLTLTHDALIRVRSTVELEDPWAEYARVEQGGR